MPYCEKCGNQVNPNDLFCSNCGNKITNQDTIYNNPQVQNNYNTANRNYNQYQYQQSSYSNAFQNQQAQFNTLHSYNSPLTILSKKIKANGIIWLVIAILQSLLGLIYLFSGFVWVNILYGIALIIIAIINFYSSYTDFYYSRSIINYPCGIVSNFRPVGGYVANLIYNIIFGGIIGIIGSIYGFTVRSYVLNNEIYFLDLEDNYLKCKKSENRFANLNQWQCSKCGKVNENYVGTCGCGNTKANSINR